MLQPNTSSEPATTPVRASGRMTRQNVRNGPAPRHAAASSSVGSTFESAVPMLMTMNGNVKIDMANTTDGRLYSNEVPLTPSAVNTGASGPPGSRIVLIPNVTYSAPNIGNTMRARTTSLYRIRRTRM